jgi:lipoyl(octanoyl) transferase
MADRQKPGWRVELGLLAYDDGLEIQRRAVAARKVGAIPDVLLECQHPHVITIGRNGHSEHLLATTSVLRQMGVGLYSTDRGGDVTYHGPGQAVGYPVVDLGGIRRDARWYVRQLEEAMIRASADYGVDGRRFEGRPGIWVSTAAGEEKLGAIGVHLSRWVSSHGFAYNVTTDLRYFDLIVPCGIRECRAISLECLLGRSLPVGEVAAGIARHLSAGIGVDFQTMAGKEFERLLGETEATGERAPFVVAAV